MKFIHIAICACVIFSANAFASEEIIFSVDTTLLERNISTCKDSVRNKKQDDIDKLKQKPVTAFKIKLTGEFMTEYVQFSNNRACSIGLLENAILILEFYLQSFNNPETQVDKNIFADVKNRLAKAKLMRASFLPKEGRASYYRDADSLVQQYIDETLMNPVGKSLPFYFASYTYIDAAELTNDDEKITLLDKAIATAKNGKNANISNANKQKLSEPLGIALGNKAKYYSGKDEGKFKKFIEESMQYMMDWFASGDNDNLAAYNIAVNYSLLNNAENSKKWLLVIEERKAVDKQICLHGLISDPDFEWFRKNQQEWLLGYFKRNCLSPLP